MDAVIQHEIRLGLWCFLLGAVLMAVYDVLRIFRRVVRHNLVAVSLEDLIFWMACMVVTFELLRVMNHGIFRYSVVLMAAFGMLAYYFLLGKYAVPWIATRLNKGKCLIKKWKRMLTSPAKNAMIKVYRFVRNRWHRRKKKREKNSSISEGKKE
ncbi:MAG: spore cortex biosynthesis protein YabQ [Lachnospiraceae bacterium]